MMQKCFYGIYLFTVFMHVCCSVGCTILVSETVRKMKLYARISCISDYIYHSLDTIIFINILTFHSECLPWISVHQSQR
jgi:hypothetical protein